MDVRERIEQLLKPDGEIMGAFPHQKSRVRRVHAASPMKEARELFAKLASLGHEDPVESPTRGSRPGLLVEVPGLGYVGYRETSTIDVNVSIEGLRNVKFKFVDEPTQERV